MSNELRTLLRDAAAVPSRSPDVEDAQRRGRASRLRRRSIGSVVALTMVAVSVTAIVHASRTTKAEHTVFLSASTAPPTHVAPLCPPLHTGAADIPSWAASAHAPSSVPHILSDQGNVVAFVFAQPLRAGTPSSAQPQNKVLWVVREPRDGKPLVIRGGQVPPGRSIAVRTTVPADSGPGEIYPSYVNVPLPGCWRFDLSWNGHHASIALNYAPALK